MSSSGRWPCHQRLSAELAGEKAIEARFWSAACWASKIGPSSLADGRGLALDRYDSMVLAAVAVDMAVGACTGDQGDVLRSTSGIEASTVRFGIVGPKAGGRFRGGSNRSGKSIAVGVGYSRHDGCGF